MAKPNEAWMAALKATQNSPEAQAIVAQIIQQAQAAEQVRGVIPKRQTIYLEPDATPLEVFRVDAREWIESGKAREVIWVPEESAEAPASPKAPEPESTPDAEEPEPGKSLDEEPDQLEELTKDQLRERWKDANPGQRVPPRASKDWFLNELRG